MTLSSPKYERYYLYAGVIWLLLMGAGYIGFGVLCLDVIFGCFRNYCLPL